MAETEVESILREIRERVLAQQRASQQLSPRSSQTSGGNGAPDSTQQIALGDGGENQTRASLSLISSYLTTTARTWDRLPPLVSNRSGFIAGVELWLKRQLKRTTRWFTWEQVNFNAATHHALRDLLPVLLAHEQELGRLGAQIAEAEARRSEQLSEFQTELQTAFQTAIESHRRALEDKVDARLTELANELRERAERIQEEQRVYFKQLALETSEAAVLEDRARRQTETLLEELQLRVEQLEKGKK